MSKIKSKNVKGKSLFFLYFVIFACLVGSVAAQKQTAPAGGQPKPFVFPKQEVYTLPNGMKVTLVPYGSVPKVALQAVIYAGTKDDAKGKIAVSEMVGQMLKEGSKTRSAEQIARETAEMGGSLSIFTGTDSTNMAGEALSEFGPQFIALMGDVLQNPDFKAADLERLRANNLRNLAISSTQPQTQAWSKFRETIFPGHPYGQINPKPDEVKGYTMADITSFYEQNYGGARTALYVVGKFDVPAVKAAIAKSFANWKRGSMATRNVPKITAKRSLTVIDRPDAPQSTIYLGMPGPHVSDPDFVKFTVMDSILGGSFGSRITANIRENKGYTYSPTSFSWTRFKTGYWVQSADVTTQFTGASIKEVLYEIGRMRSEPVTEAELSGIKNYLIGIYVLQNSARTGVIGQLERMNYNEQGKDYLDSYISKLSAVTAADVREMAKKYLTEDKMTIVVVGDKAKIAEQLKPYEK
jgi:predicted Zn-dependent peptidase